MRILLTGGVGEYEEKKSRFIATLRPVSTPEEAAAFFEKQFIIRADIPRPVRHDAFVQIAERAFLFGFIIGIGIPERIIGALPESGQRQELLFIR